MQLEPTYVSLHIFYHTGDMQSLLTDCIAPLVGHLQDDALISRYFFIRYWMGGPHLRLRLLPSPDTPAELVRKVAKNAIALFLEEMPSLIDLDELSYRRGFRQLYESEFGKELYLERYPSGQPIPLLPNNSIQDIDYQPEYTKYGGVAGVKLAEQHFEFSSSLALRVIRQTNVQVRSVILGQACELMIEFAKGFIASHSTIAKLFGAYGQAPSPYRTKLYEQAYMRQRDKLKDRLHDTTPPVTPQFEELARLWHVHGATLSTQVRESYRVGDLKLMPEVTSEGDAIWRLASQYIHMMNNRLGVKLHEENYLAYLLGRAFEETRESNDGETYASH